MRGLRGCFALVGLLCALSLAGCGLPWPFPQPTPDLKLPDSQQIMKPLEVGPNAGDVSTLDPALIDFASDYQFAQLIFPQLVTLDEQQRPVDWAAESHEVSGDGLTYTFHLRKGMQWSDGTPIDAQTFAYSINRALDPCTGSDVANYLYNIKGAQEFNGGYPFNQKQCPTGAKVSADTLIGKSIVVADPLTLKLTLEAPAGHFLAALTYPTSWAVPQLLVERYTTPAPPPSNASPFPLPTSTWTEHLADNGGFGGNLFKLTRWDHQGHLDFARNERFWGRKPLLRTIEYTLFRDIDREWDTYETGTGDVGLPPTPQIDAAKTLKGSTFHQFPQLAFLYLMPNWKQAPFDDMRVRQAFSLAIDRQAIAHDILKDTSQPTIHLMPEELPGYNPDLADASGRKGKDAIKPDVVTARKLANEYASEKCGGDFVKCPPVVFMVTSNRPTTALVAQVMQKGWQDAFPGWSIVIGGPCRLQICPGRTFQLTNASWGADYPDPQDFMSLLWTTSASYNRDSVSISQVDQLCAQADSMSDLSARIPLYQQAEQLLITQGAAIPYAQPLTTYVVRSQVVGWSIASSGETPLSAWQGTYLTR